MNAMFFGMPNALFPQFASHLGGRLVVGVSTPRRPSAPSLSRDERMDGVGASRRARSA